jgi:hypothetical protein
MPMTDVEYIFYSKPDAQRFQQWIFNEHLVTQFKIKTIKSDRGTECRRQVLQLWKPASQWPIPIEVRTRPRPTNGHFLVYYHNEGPVDQQQCVKIPRKRRDAKTHGCVPADEWTVIECQLPAKSDKSGCKFTFLPRKPFSHLKYLRIEFSEEGLKPKTEQDLENGKLSSR